MMEYLIAGLLLVLVVVLVLWIAPALRRDRDAMDNLKQDTDALRRELTDSLTRHLSIVNEQLSSITSQVATQLSSVTSQLQTSTGQLNQRMDNAARVVGELKQSLGELSKAAEQIFEVGRDISTLQEILRSPKLRGGLGEFLLEDLLRQILPEQNYTLQYKFRNGKTVDAIIRLSHGLVPVDAKFPLENFKRILAATVDRERRDARRSFVQDVKKHIDKIAQDYIMHEEGTFNFALMYIPAENVYYETIIKEEPLEEAGLWSYALSKRVIPVSPNSLYAYLQTIVMGLKGLEISKKAQAILKHLESLGVEFDKVADDFETLGRHITNSRNKYDDTLKRMEKFREKLSGVERLKEFELKELP